MTVLRLQLASYQPNQPVKVEGEGEGREKTWRTCSFPFVFSLTTPRVLSGEEGRGNDNVDRAGTGPEAHGRSSRRNSKRLRTSAQDHRPGSRGWEGAFALRKPPTLDSTSSPSSTPRRSSTPLPPSLSLLWQEKAGNPCANPPAPPPPKLLGPPRRRSARDQPAAAGKQPKDPCFSSASLCFSCGFNLLFPREPVDGNGNAGVRARGSSICSCFGGGRRICAWSDGAALLERFGF